MKAVDINGRFLTQTMTGVQRYGIEMVRALDLQLASSAELRTEYSMRLVAPRRLERELALRYIPTQPVGRLSGQAWEQLELPFHSRGRLLLNLCNTAPLARRAVATIHDASVFVVPEAYSKVFAAWYRTLIPLLGKRALRIVTTSRFSRAELVRFAGIPAEKIQAISLGAEHILEPQADPGVFRRVPVEPGRYVLAVGSQSLHKNLRAVLQAMGQLHSERVALVAAGGSNSRIFAAAELSRDGAIHAGYVTDGELRALYESALCFAYPSFYEGFGLPPVEAMACGCPVVVSRAAALPEVCGDAALYCDPQDPTDLAVQLRCLIREPARREELRERGLERARCFTWKRASTALLQLIDQIQPA